MEKHTLNNEVFMNFIAFLIMKKEERWMLSLDSNHTEMHKLKIVQGKSLMRDGSNLCAQQLWGLFSNYYYVEQLLEKSHNYMTHLHT